MSSTHSVPPRPRIAAIVVALVASAALGIRLQRAAATSTDPR